MERIHELRIKTRELIDQIGIRSVFDFIDAVKLSQSPFLQGSLEHVRKWMEPEKAGQWIKWTSYGGFSRNYHENLRSSAWLELSHILKAKSIHCIVCSTTKGLHLHHTFYDDSRYLTLPWLYPTRSLITVCRSCHNQIHALENWKVEQFSLFQHYSYDDWPDW